MDAYRADIDRLVAENGFKTVDVVSIAPDNPQREAMRAKFLDEHFHKEDEVRFFVAGSGLFTLHVEDKVYEIKCEQGDLIARARQHQHWFDMGPEPSFIAIRFFTEPDGWVGHFTGTDIAQRFPRYETGRRPERRRSDPRHPHRHRRHHQLHLLRQGRAVPVRAPRPARASSPRTASEPEVRNWLDAVAAENGGMCEDAMIVEVLQGWIDEDRKHTALKALQGMIWADGYRSADFTAPHLSRRRRCAASAGTRRIAPVRVFVRQRAGAASCSSATATPAT